MGLKLAEATVYYVTNFLQTYLDAQLAAVAANAADAIELPSIKEWIRGERQAMDFPSGWVMVNSSAPDIDENRDSFNSQFPSGIWKHDLEVVIALTDPDDPDRLRTKLYRYVRAVHELFRQYEGYTPDVAEWIRARVTGHNYSRLFQHVQESVFRQDAHVLVQVSRAD